jgi:hypothetical protein
MDSKLETTLSIMNDEDRTPRDLGDFDFIEVKIDGT